MSDEVVPHCPYCGRSAEQIPGLVFDANIEGMTPDEYAREDGTYNQENGHFACDEDYLKIGMPSVPMGRWVCP